MGKIRVMLVDDDRLAIEYMRGIVEWEELGYEVVAAAYNGKQALRLLDQYSPQLVITDISMAHMDGIELCQKIRERSKEVRVVLLTAYGEFEYARQAVQLGVDYYLIKDEVDAEYMKERLLALRELIANQVKISQIMFQKMLIDYFQIGEKYVEALYQDKSVTKFLKLNYYYAIFEKNSPVRIGKRTVEESEAMPEFLEHCLRAASENGMEISLHSLIPHDRILLVLENKDSSEYETKKFLLFSMKQIQKQLETEMNCRCTGYVSAYPVKFRDVYEMLTGQNSIFNCRLFTGIGKIYNMEENCWKNAEMPTVESGCFQKAIDAGDFSEKIQSLFKKCLEDQVNSRSFTECIEEAYQALHTEEKKQLSLRYQQEMEPENYYDFEEAVQGLCKYYEKIREGRKNAVLKKEFRPEARKAMEYIQEHFQETQLKVSDIADYLKLSESRISVIFKKETGKTLIQYLTELRIENAKKLLKNTELKVYEIAETVGYSNSQYLSNLFYKEVGCFPLEYRKNGK